MIDQENEQNSLQKVLQNVVNALKTLAKTIVEIVTKAMNQFMNTLILSSKNKKWLYFYSRSKNKRVRKKYRKLILKSLYTIQNSSSENE